MQRFLFYFPYGSVQNSTCSEIVMDLKKYLFQYCEEIQKVCKTRDCPDSLFFNLEFMFSKTIRRNAGWIM